MRLNTTHLSLAERRISNALTEIEKRFHDYRTHMFTHIRCAQDPETVFLRGLFAYASVHTTWEMNCTMYRALHDYENWLSREEKLLELLRGCKAGLMNNRARFIMEYAEQYWQRPKFFLRMPDESWQEYRHRLEKLLPGIGPAKAAFFAELIYGYEAECVCVDTHMMQTYGFAPNVVFGATDYDLLEWHWVLFCNGRLVNPVIARWVMWDMKQGKPDSTYWTNVLLKETDV